ncbi:MAG: hypothetical protein OEL76_00885 [Siculibacillus sp.]|nr:hypothetical protein [Siculibacillus sp.]
MSTGPLVLALLFVVLLIPIVTTAQRVGATIWERTWGRNWRWMALVAVGSVIGWLIAKFGNLP